VLTTPHCKNLPCYGTYNKDDAQNVISKRIFILVSQRRQLNTETNDRFPHISVFFSFPSFTYSFLYFLVFCILSSFLSVPFSSFLSPLLFLSFISRLLIVGGEIRKTCKKEADL